MRPERRSGYVTLILTAKASCDRPVLTSLEYDSGWLSQGAEECTLATNAGNRQLTCPPVNGEVNAANDAAKRTKTALGRVEASHDKKRRRHNAMDTLADGGAEAAQKL
jgi:hypothetical protein